MADALPPYAQQDAAQRRTYFREKQRRFRAAHPELREAQREYTRQWHAIHREHDKNYQKNYVRPATTPVTARTRHLKKVYGLTPEDFEVLLISQCGTCAICGDPFGEVTPHIDHNHRTNEVRGLLCSPCNRAIGGLRDDPQIIQRAMEYVS